MTAGRCRRWKKKKVAIRCSSQDSARPGLKAALAGRGTVATMGASLTLPSVQHGGNSCGPQDRADHPRPGQHAASAVLRAARVRDKGQAWTLRPRSPVWAGGRIPSH